MRILILGDSFNDTLNSRCSIDSIQHIFYNILLSQKSDKNKLYLAIHSYILYRRMIISNLLSQGS